MQTPPRYGFITPAEMAAAAPDLFRVSSPPAEPSFASLCASLLADKPSQAGKAAEA